MSHTPMRRCRVCRTISAKSELKRWTLVDAKLVTDLDQIAPGRGYYSCSDRCSEIIPKTIKTIKQKVSGN